jgi:hypothetical protein
MYFTTIRNLLKDSNRIPMKLSVQDVTRLLPICVIFAGCNKSLSHSDVVANNPTATFTTDITKSPSYGESTLYVQGGSSQFKPVNTLGAGNYVAWPAGITIDRNTGVIDASKTEPGSRYNVGFVSTVTGDTAYNQVIIAGVTYADGIYALDSKDSIVRPYYNANSASLATGTVLSASGEGLNVSSTDGSINLGNSLRQGLFGSNPQNGDTKEIPVYYRLNDQSNGSLMRSTVIVHYYNTLADVPASLVSTTKTSREAFTGRGAFLNDRPLGSSAALNPPTTTTASAPVTPRPPQVVLVVKGH